MSGVAHSPNIIGSRAGDVTPTPKSYIYLLDSRLGPLLFYIREKIMTALHQIAVPFLGNVLLCDRKRK